ncbi:SRPBCC family protein [Streptomyces sp. NPDC002619]|uniref:SRPBCC family protein n=1 Tax=Streptomyces sp. NPDC002619 TaxID=3364655 RepID=UPI0036B5E62D
MKIDNEFDVDVPVERAWEALTDLEGLAPCMPGAQLTGVDGDIYRGKVRVKVGPVISQFQGTARFTEKDEAAHSAVISAAGKDTRGQGNASATIHALLRPEGAGTVVTVSTDLNISGKLAQFGSGMIKEISEKLFAQFVANVEKQLLAPAEPETTVPDPVPATVPAVAVEPEAAVRSAEAETASESASAQAARQPEPAEQGEPLDLMRLAGTSVYKRLIPVAVGAVVVGVVIYLLVR